MGVILLSSAINSHAAAITMNFTVEGLSSDTPFGGPSPPGPTTTVSGTITWEGASITDKIDQLTSLDLNILGHTYSLAEIDYTHDYSDMIYATVNDTGIATGSHDFWIRWDKTTTTPVDFVYATTGTVGIWDSSNFTEFSITAVPVPAAAWLFGSALIGLAGVKRKK